MGITYPHGGDKAIPGGWKKYVRKCDLLLVIDPTNYRIAVSQSEADRCEQCYGLARFGRETLRPCGNGLGARAPLAGCAKNSASGTSSVFANRSKRSIVGFSVCRSSPPT